MDRPTILARSPRSCVRHTPGSRTCGWKGAAWAARSKRPGVILQPTSSAVWISTWRPTSSIFPRRCGHSNEAPMSCMEPGFTRQATRRGRTLKREFVSRRFNFHRQALSGSGHFRCDVRLPISAAPLYPKLAAAGAVSDGWFFSAEVLVVAQWQGMTVVELPVHWTDSPTSKVRVVSLSLEYLKAMRGAPRPQVAGAGKIAHSAVMLSPGGPRGSPREFRLQARNRPGYAPCHWS